MAPAYCVRENPAGIQEHYLRCLQLCFPGAWTRRSFAWFHLRKFRERVPDLLTVYDGDEVVAGVCVNFRQLRLPLGKLADVGILTAAWSLPAHRGRWHLARLIKAAKALGAKRGYDALLAFVRADNACSAVLKHAGATSVDSYYVHAEPGQSIDATAEADVTESPVNSPTAGTAAPIVSFHYSDAEEWCSQFLDRPGGTTFTKAASCAVISDSDDRTSRVQFIEGPAAQHAAAIATMAGVAAKANKKFVHFSTSSELARRAALRGLAVDRGYIMIFELGEHDRDAEPARRFDTRAVWRVSPGDRM